MNNIQSSLECICSILYHFGIEHVTPDSFQIAKTNSITIKNKQLKEETVNLFMKTMHDMILIHKSASMKSVHGIWNKIQYDTQMVTLFVHQFMLQNNYIRALYFNSELTNTREILYAFAWIFHVTDMTSLYLRCHINDQMFHSDPSMAYSDLIQKENRLSSEQVVLDHRYDETTEILLNKLIVKVNKIYMTTRNLYYKGQQTAILTSELNELFPMATPSELHLVVESLTKKPSAQKLTMHEKQISFHTLVYGHMCTFYEWIESVVAQERLLASDQIQSENTVEINPSNVDIEQLQQTVVEKYKQLREDLVKGAELMKQNSSGTSRKSSRKVLQEKPKLPTLQSFMDQYAKSLTPTPSQQISAANNDDFRFLRQIKSVGTASDSTIITGARREIERLNEELVIIQERLAEKRVKREQILHNTRP
jgi:hypothetical protein